MTKDEGHAVTDGEWVRVPGVPPLDLSLGCPPDCPACALWEAMPEIQVKRATSPYTVEVDEETFRQITQARGE